MNNTATQIARIISTPNPSAPITTHALAELGNGSMQDGLKRIVLYFAAESASNLRLGRMQGGIVGVLGTTVVAGGIALAYHFSQKKQLETEGRIILDTLQKPSTVDAVIAERIPTGNITKNSTINSVTTFEK